MPQPNKIPLAFASSGDKNAIPENTETTGLASWREGFPAITSAPFSEGGIAPKRADFNGIFYALSQAVMWMQQGGVYVYDVNTDYEAGNVVLDAGGLYVADAANGPSSVVVQPSTDTTGATWKLVRLNLATQSAAGYMSKEDKAALDGVPTTYLPLSGGTLTGVLNTKDIYLDNATIRSKLDTQNINVYGGIGWQHGAYLSVCGKDEPNSPGYFYLRADNGVTNKTLQGRPDGTLTWNNKDVTTIQTGTWTPTLYGATTTGAFSYTTRVGEYCKIGQLVYIHANLQCDCTTAPVGQACINGIPFSCEDESGVGGFSILISGAGTSYSLKRLCGLKIKSNYIILRITSEGDNTVDNANFNPNDSSGYNLKIPSGQSIVLGFSAVYRTTQ